MTLERPYDGYGEKETKYQFLDLSDEIIVAVESLRDAIIDTGKRGGDMEPELSALNSYLSAQDLIGAHVKVHSDDLRLTRERLILDDEGQVEIESQLEFAHSSTAEGVLMRCDLSILNSGVVEVCYIIEKIDDDISTVEIATPVDMARISVALPESSLENSSEGGYDLMDALEILGRDKDQYVQQRVEEMAISIESQEEIGAPFLTRLGGLATELLRWPAYEGDLEIEQAVCVVFSDLTQGIDVALLTGLEMIPGDIEDGRRVVSITQSKLKGVVAGVAMVDGFDLFLSDDDSHVSVDASDVCQPALVIEDQLGNERYFPFRYLEKFYDVENGPQKPETCYEITQRLRQESPEYFDYKNE